MSDYNEHLISQAGGDGDAQAVIIIVQRDNEQWREIRFTNVPMHRIHAAIALLNGDTETAANTMQAQLERNLKAIRDESVAPGTKEFTVAELFPYKPLNVDGDPCSICRECGSIVSNPGAHTRWHNKTLP